MGITRYGTRNSIRRGAADAARTASQAGFVMDAGRLKMTTTLNMNSNKIINLADGVAASDGAAKGQAGGGGDARSIITRTYQISAASIAGLGHVTTGTLELFTLEQYEGIRWCWMHNATAFTGGTMWCQFGVISALNSLYLQQNVTAIGHYDDNAMHGQHFQIYGEMGDKKYSSSYNVGDSNTYLRTGNTIHLHLATYGGAYMDTIGGGDLRINVEIVRFDDAQKTVI